MTLFSLFLLSVFRLQKLSVSWNPCLFPFKNVCWHPMRNRNQTENRAKYDCLELPSFYVRRHNSWQNTIKSCLFIGSGKYYSKATIMPSAWEFQNDELLNCWSLLTNITCNCSNQEIFLTKIEPRLSSHSNLQFFKITRLCSKSICNWQVYWSYLFNYWKVPWTLIWFSLKF